MNIIESLNRGLETKYHLNEAKEDKERFLNFAGQDLYDRFETLKSKQIIKCQDADYTYWEKQSIDALRDFIEKTEAKQNEKNKERTAVTQHYRQISDLVECEDYNFIYSGNGWTIYEVLTHKASMWLGKDTKWCITMKNNPSFFYQYKNNGANYYFLIPDKNPESGKWCYLYYNKELNLSDKYFWDSKDISYMIEDVDIPYNVLSSLPGISQNLVDYVQSKKNRKSIQLEIMKEVQRTGVYTYNPLDDLSFIQKLSPQKVVVSDNIKEIGGYAFTNCTSLKEINIPDSVKEIGYYAFSRCISLKEINIPDSVKEIGEYAFYECGSIQEITISDSVKEIGKYAFYNCTSLQNITLSDRIEKIEQGVFENCTSLKEIVIPNSVKEIGFVAFNGCTSLQEITLPNSVKKVEDAAFYNCKSLQKIILPDSVKEIGESAFDKCTSLKEIVIPNGVKYIGDYTFNGCASLKEIYLPDKTEKIGNKGFMSCISLKEIRLPYAINSIGMDAFWGCTSLQEIKIKGEYRPQIFKYTDLNDTVILNWIDCGIKETWGEVRDTI